MTLHATCLRSGSSGNKWWDGHLCGDDVCSSLERLKEAGQVRAGWWNSLLLFIETSCMHIGIWGSVLFSITFWNELMSHYTDTHKHKNSIT